MPRLSPPSLYEETQAQLRAQAEEAYEEMVRARDRYNNWVNGICVALAAFALVGASLLWPGVKAWLRVRLGW